MAGGEMYSAGTWCDSNSSSAMVVRLEIGLLGGSVMSMGCSDGLALSCLE